MSDIEGVEIRYDPNTNNLYVSNFFKGQENSLVAAELIEVCQDYYNGQKLVAALAIEALTMRFFGQTKLDCPAKRVVDSLLEQSPFDLGTPLFDDDEDEDDDDDGIPEPTPSKT